MAQDTLKRGEIQVIKIFQNGNDLAPLGVINEQFLCYGQPSHPRIAIVGFCEISIMEVRVSTNLRFFNYGEPAMPLKTKVNLLQEK